MALFNLLCTKCGFSCRKMAVRFDDLTTQNIVCKCGYLMHRKMVGPSTSVMERLDNGSMVKSLERYADAEQIFKDRHDNADPLAGTKPNRS
jgi:formylmethanofuran dehydrogenase subunit B